MFRNLHKAVWLLLSATTAAAAVPQLVSFQGVLTDGSGNPVADGPYTVAFTVYDAASAGTALWAETTAVSTTDGLFSVLLGALHPVPDSAFTSPNRWLGIKVASDPEMVPRQRLVSVAYGYRVSTIDGASGGNITSKVSIGPGHTNTGNHAFVAGQFNSATGHDATVGGGGSNQASGDGAVVSGGVGNEASGVDAAVGGGTNNEAGGYQSKVGGGLANNATSLYATVGGGYLNLAGSVGSTVAGGQRNESGGDYAFVGGGSVNRARGLYSTIGGGGGVTLSDSNFAGGNWAVIGGGLRNIVTGTNATVGGGRANQALAGGAVIAGGSQNVASGVDASVGGGVSDTASGNNATVAGGLFNHASGPGSAIGGGNRNRAPGTDASIGGGFRNSASGARATVTGGDDNAASGPSAWVGGGTGDTASGNQSGVASGWRNVASATRAFIGGGDQNKATAYGTAILGGAENVASGLEAIVCGGLQNTASGQWATLGGGSKNKARGDYSVVAGGGGVAFFDSNAALGHYSTVSGGSRNVSLSSYACVAGGFSNYSGGLSATVGGGDSDTASGAYATVPGGFGNKAGDAYSFAAGRQAKALHSGTFVWADNSGTDFASSATNQFLIRASGGVGLGTASPLRQLHVHRTGSPFVSRFESSSTDAAVTEFSNTSNSNVWELGVTGSAGAFGTLASGSMYWYRQGSGAPFLAINSFGQVGIGTNTPADRLHTAGDIRVGTGTTGCVKDADGTVIAGICSSDERLKTRIEAFPDMLEQVTRLQPVHFYWKSAEEPERHFGDHQSFGLIAQEVEKIMPELVAEDDEGYLAVRYNKLPLLLLQALREQQALILEQQSQLEELKVRLSSLEAASQVSRAER